MKLLKLSLFALVLLALTIPAFAQDDDYWGEEQNWITKATMGSHPVWSPDGNWIAYLSGNPFEDHAVFVIPAEGGEPIFIYKNEIELSDTDSPEVVLTRSLRMRDLAFTPDSQRITFNKFTVDEDLGSIVHLEIRDDGSSSGSISKSFQEIVSVDFFTGEVTAYTDGTNSIYGYDQCWSHDGRYLVYVHEGVDSYTVDFEKISVLDTETNETWFVASRSFSPEGFTADDSEIVLTDRLGNIFKVPFEGGEKELIGFVEGGFSSQDLSLDGTWLLMKTQEGDLSVYNILTGEQATVLEANDYYGISSSVFFPDCTQICYIRENKDPSGDYIPESYSPYIVDFDSEQYLKITDVESETPESFAVMSNFPNPFNPTTTIQFTLPEAGFTQLVIYNIMGQKIRELVSADMPAGVHSAVWDGRDQQGNPASSGLFVSRLTSGVNVVTNRMVLVK
ncbi:FlgD immunoglobulin-like domain containing protein [Candidatus Latescibacterota bacterium]